MVFITPSWLEVESVYLNGLSFLEQSFFFFFLIVTLFILVQLFAIFFRKVHRFCLSVCLVLKVTGSNVKA